MILQFAVGLISSDGPVPNEREPVHNLNVAIVKWDRSPIRFMVCLIPVPGGVSLSC